VGWGKQATFEQNASISETVEDTYKVTISDEVYSPHGGSTDSDSIVTDKHRLTDRYKYNKTDTIKTNIGSCRCDFDWHQDR